MSFCTKILAYYSENKRDLPWRKSKDPYKIWLSEIIMQQTQISQGTAYYQRFIKKYPTVFDLAQADEQDILLLWQGLGYYSRARNLHHSAKIIAEKYSGKFPETYEKLRQLKGIGEYTASAILSICYGQPLPAVDGNVLRVISRIFNINEPINHSSGKKVITEKCKTLICKDNPGDFNQALMDFGSTQCTSTNGKCSTCIFKNECEAYRLGKVSELPVKIKPKAKITEYYHYFIIRFNDKLFIRKRTEGIWKNLFEFPLINSKTKISEKMILTRFNKKFLSDEGIVFPETSESYKHVLSHKILFVKFYTTTVNKTQFDQLKIKGFDIINTDKIKEYPFPQIIRKHLSTIKF